MKFHLQFLVLYTHSDIHLLLFSSMIFTVILRAHFQENCPPWHLWHDGSIYNTKKETGKNSQFQNPPPVIIVHSYPLAVVRGMLFQRSQYLHSSHLYSLKALFRNVLHGNTSPPVARSGGKSVSQCNMSLNHTAFNWLLSRAFVLFHLKVTTARHGWLPEEAFSCNTPMRWGFLCPGCIGKGYECYGHTSGIKSFVR